MKITQELLKKSWICKSLYLLDTSRSIKLTDFRYSLQRFILISYLFMGLCKPNRNKRAHLKCPLSSYLNKEVEKENFSPSKLH